MHKTSKGRPGLTKVQIRAQEPGGSAFPLPFEVELLGKAKIAFENHRCEELLLLSVGESHF